MFFTDAAFESEALTGGLGAVLLSSSGEVIRWAGQNLDPSFMASIIAEDQKSSSSESLKPLQFWQPSACGRIGLLQSMWCSSLTTKPPGSVS